MVRVECIFLRDNKNLKRKEIFSRGFKYLLSVLLWFVMVGGFAFVLIVVYFSCFVLFFGFRFFYVLYLTYIYILLRKLDFCVVILMGVGFVIRVFFDFLKDFISIYVFYGKYLIIRVLTGEVRFGWLFMIIMVNIYFLVLCGRYWI